MTLSLFLVVLLLLLISIYSSEVEEYDDGLGGTIFYVRPKAIHNPTLHPTDSPSNHITHHPTSHPTRQPTLNPTASPTTKPTKPPTIKPTKKPTMKPTLNPTKAPTDQWDSTSARRAPIIKPNAHSSNSISDTQLLNRYKKSHEHTPKPNHTQTKTVAIELYRYHNPLGNRTDDNALFFPQEHIHHLISKNEHCLFIVPYTQTQALQAYNPDIIRYYASERTIHHVTIMSFLPNIFDITTLIDGSTVLKLYHFFKGLSPSPYRTEALRFFESIEGVKAAITDILPPVFKYMEFGLNHVLQNQIKLIEQILTNTTYGTHGKVRKAHLSDVRRIKQNLNGTLRDIASLLAMTLKTYQSGTSNVHLADFSMMTEWVGRITMYWAHVFHFEQSLQIARIVYEWKRQQKTKPRAPIGIVVSAVYLTADLLHNIGYSESDIKMFTVSTHPDDGGHYALSELPSTPPIIPPVSIPINHTENASEPVMHSTVQMFVSHTGFKDRDAPEMIAKQVSILNDPQYDVVIVENGKALNLSTIQQNRYCISESTTQQMFETLYGLVVSYIRDLSGKDISKLTALTFDTLSRVIHALATNNTLYYQIMKQLKSQSMVHPQFPRMVLKYYLSVQENGYAIAMMDLPENSISQEMFGSVFFFLTATLECITNAKFHEMDEFKQNIRTSPLLLQTLGIGIKAMADFPAKFVAVSTFADDQNNKTKLALITQLELDMTTLVTSFTVATKYCQIDAMMSEWSSVDRNSSIAFVCGATNCQIAMQALQGIGYNASAIHIQNLTVETARTPAHIVRLYMLNEETQFIEQQKRIVQDTSNKVVIVMDQEALEIDEQSSKRQMRHHLHTTADIRFDRAYLLMDHLIAVLENTTCSDHDMEIKENTIKTILEQFIYQMVNGWSRDGADRWMDRFVRICPNPSSFIDMIPQYYEAVKSHSNERIKSIKPEMIDNIFHFIRVYFYHINLHKIISIERWMKILNNTTQTLTLSQSSAQLINHTYALLDSDWLGHIQRCYSCANDSEAAETVSKTGLPLVALRISLTTLKRLSAIGGILFYWQRSAHDGAVAIASSQSMIVSTALMDLLHDLGYDESSIQRITFNESTAEDTQPVPVDTANYTTIRGVDALKIFVIDGALEHIFVDEELKIINNISNDMVFAQQKKALNRAQITSHRYLMFDVLDLVFEALYRIVHGFLTRVETIKYGTEMDKCTIVTLEHLLYHATLYNDDTFALIMSKVQSSKPKYTKAFKKIVIAHYKRIEKAAAPREFLSDERQALSESPMMHITFAFIRAYFATITSTQISSISDILQHSHYGNSAHIPRDLVDAFSAEVADVLSLLTGDWWDHVPKVCLERKEDSLRFIRPVKAIVQNVADSIQGFKLWFSISRTIYDWRSAGNHGAVAIIVSSNSAFMTDSFAPVLQGLGYHETLMHRISNNTAKDIEPIDVLTLMVIDNATEQEYAAAELEVCNNASNDVVISIMVSEAAQIKTHRYAVVNDVDDVFGLVYQTMIDFLRDVSQLVEHAHALTIGVLEQMIWYLTRSNECDLHGLFDWILSKARDKYNMKSFKSFQRITTAQYKRMKDKTFRKFSREDVKLLINDQMMRILFDFMHTYFTAISTSKINAISRIILNSNYGKSDQMPTEVSKAFMKDKRKDLLAKVNGHWWDHIVAICVDKQSKSLRYVSKISAILLNIVQTADAFKVWFETARLIYDWRSAGHHGTVVMIASSNETVSSDMFMEIVGGLGYNESSIRRIYWTHTATDHSM
eukprot:3687_1